MTLFDPHVFDNDVFDTTSTLDPAPTLSILMSRSGWLLGDPVASILGTTTILGYSGTTEIGPARRCTIRRGRQHELDRIEAGRANIRLPNRDGRFDPTNAASPLAPDVRPMIPVQVRAIYEAVNYPLLTGFAEGWPQQWTRGPAGDSWVEITVVDGFKWLNLARVTIDRPVETAGARINAVLDAAGWSSVLRAVDTGDSNVQAVTLEAANALSHIQDVAASEGGVFFMSRDGLATFFGRFHTVLVDEINDVWGEDGTEHNYEDVTFTYEEAHLWNEVTVTAPGLNAQKAIDVSSQGLYGPRTLTVSTLLTTEAEMLERADALVARYSTPERRVSGLSPEPRGEPVQWLQVLPKDIHSRIVARKKPPSGGLIDQPSMIEGITYEIASQRFQPGWSLSSTLPQVGQWILGDAVFSILGQTTSLVST